MNEKVKEIEKHKGEKGEKIDCYEEKKDKSGEKNGSKEGKKEGKEAQIKQGKCRQE